MAEAPVITAMLPYFGGKRTLAPRIVRELGEHAAYWEPFCGSMAVLLAKPVAPMETVNDLNGDVVNLARCVRDPVLGPRLYRRLRRTLASKALMDEAAAAWAARGTGPAPERPDADRAYDYFVSSWMGRNGVTGTKSYNQGYSRRFTKNGGHAATRWCGAVDSIPAWRRRMRSVSVLNEDAFGILERIEDAAGVVIYCDPPYVVKGATYVHDFAIGDHERLRDALARFRRTRVVVSYYDHEVVRELYEGWTCVECTVAKSLVNQGMRDQQSPARAPEVLLINGPSYTGGGLFAGALAAGGA